MSSIRLAHVGTSLGNLVQYSNSDFLAKFAIADRQTVETVLTEIGLLSLFR